MCCNVTVREVAACGISFVNCCGWGHTLGCDSEGGLPSDAASAIFRYAVAYKLQLPQRTRIIRILHFRGVGSGNLGANKTRLAAGSGLGRRCVGCHTDRPVTHLPWRSLSKRCDCGISCGGDLGQHDRRRGPLAAAAYAQPSIKAVGLSATVGAGLNTSPGECQEMRESKRYAGGSSMPFSRCRVVCA